MTSIDWYPLFVEAFGPQCIEKSDPPHDIRFENDDSISGDLITGKWQVIKPNGKERVEIDGEAIGLYGGSIKEVTEALRKQNGDGDWREKLARQVIAEIEAEQAEREAEEARKEGWFCFPAGSKFSDEALARARQILAKRKSEQIGLDGEVADTSDLPGGKAKCPESEPVTGPASPAAAEPDPAPTPQKHLRSRSDSQPNPRLIAALDYAERGWDVFPAPPGKKKSYKSAKHSGGANWGKTRDPKQIQKDFRKWPDANIGIPTGADNGIWVLETDTPKGHNVDGEASLRALEAKHEPLPETLMAESPSGSRHRYFNWPKGVVIKNSTSAIGPGIDVRGEGGMVIAPPSVRAGGAYRWLNDKPIADAPQWLIDLAVGNDLGLARKHAGSNGGEAPDRLEVAPEFADLPVEDMGEGIETPSWWDPLSPEQKDAALDHGLECIANNSNLLKLRNDNTKWFQLVTSVARSGAPHRADIFVKHAGAVPGADSEEELRKKLAYCEKNPRGITVATFIKWARECGANFEPWYETRSADQNAEAHTTAAGGLGEWDAGDEPGTIPPRQWLLGNQFCRGFISSIVAAGGGGKSALRLLQFISMALGRSLCGQHVFRRCRVLLISLEDDRDELQRRIKAVLDHYEIDRKELKGWLFCASPKLAKLAEMKNRTRAIGPLEQQIRDAIKRRNPDIISLDPFIKTHGLEENDSGDMDFVCDLLARMGIEFNIAVDSPHHVHKGQITPGDADSGRGSSGIRDAGRLVYTLTPMSEADAKIFNINPNDRFSYVRLDSAKVNLAARSGKAEWFHIIGQPIGNSTDEYPNGDTIQVVEPWAPPDAWKGTTHQGLNAILTDIDYGLTDDDGKPTGQRYSNAPRSPKRAVWPVVQKHYPDKSEAQCREIIHAWLNTKLLYPEEYDDPVERKKCKGLKVDNSKRPS